MFEVLIEQTWNYLRTGGITMIPLAGVSLWLWLLIFMKMRDLFGVKYYLDGMIKDPMEQEAWLKKERERLDRNIDTILVLAQIAPLLGLLGTVTGMISTFESISIFGTGNAKALSRGISEALVTTQCGLVVAIPGLLMGHFLKRRAEVCSSRMKAQGFGSASPSPEVVSAAPAFSGRS